MSKKNHTLQKETRNQTYTQCSLEGRYNRLSTFSSLLLLKKFLRPSTRISIIPKFYSSFLGKGVYTILILKKFTSFSLIQLSCKREKKGVHTEKLHRNVLFDRNFWNVLLGGRRDTCEGIHGCVSDPVKYVDISGDEFWLSYLTTYQYHHSHSRDDN